MTSRFSFFITLGLALATVACSSTGSSGSDGGEGGTRGTPSTFRDVGPWEAGVTTLTLADRSVEVWYPVPNVGVP